MSDNQLISSAGIPVFDPRDLNKSDVQRNIWTSESVELYNQAIKNGDPVTSSPYNNRIKGFNLRAPNLPFQYSDDELELMAMAMEDKILFGNNFIELKDPEKGEWTKVKLRDYQESLLHKYSSNRWHILKFPRQSGKTTTTIVEIVHFLTFNVDKDVVVAAQSDNVVAEIFAKIKSAFSALPFFMQPGVKRWSDSEGELELDNGCRLKIGIASESVFQGFTLDLVFIDEFAYIPESRANKFWINLYPALQANPNSRCIIASTPNGRNFFYEMWQKAVKEISTFIPSHIHWTDVPRSIPLEQFKAETIANIGLKGWLMGYECSFDTQLKSIFTTKTQVQLRNTQNIIEEKPDYYWNKDNHVCGETYNISFLNQNEFAYNLREDHFILSIDIGEGLDADYSVIKIRKAFYNTETKTINYKLIGVFHDNTYSVQDFATNFMKFVSNEMDTDKIKVVVENNNYGAEFFLTIKMLKMHSDDTVAINFDDFVFAEFMRDSKDDFEKGIRWNKANKKTAVRNYRGCITKGVFDDSFPDSIDEAMNFGRIKDSYRAQYGHDDLTMADITAAYYVANPSNDNFIQDLPILLSPIEIEKRKIEEEKKKKFTYEVNGFTLRKSTEKKKRNFYHISKNGPTSLSRQNKRRSRNERMDDD